MIRTISTFILGIFFIIAGINHFLSPGFYLSIMPPYLPWHLPLVYISGIAEIAGGAGVIIPKTRRMAGWCLIALLLAVFPANIQMLLNSLWTLNNHGSNWLLWVRLPLQFVLIWWVYWTFCSRPYPGRWN
jgi:uncharacterized membrane protein